MYRAFTFLIFLRPPIKKGDTVSRIALPKADDADL